MRAQKQIYILATIFVVVLITALIAFNHQKPRLLVLHTYSEEGLWEKSFNRGVDRVLQENRKPLETRWQYMTFTDSDIPTQAEWDASGTRARSVIDRWDPDVMLVVGEEAQDFVGRHYINNQDIKIVYAMGENPDYFGYSTAKNVTGINERLPLAAITELLRIIKDGPVKVRAIGINDATGVAEREQLLSFDWGSNTLLNVSLASDLAQWRNFVQNAADADVLLVLSSSGLRADKNKNKMTDTKALIQWTVQNANPMTIGVRENFVAYGGAISIIPSAVGLGAQSTQLVMQLITNPDAAIPKPQNNRDFVIALRPSLLNEWDIHLPDIYMQSARTADLIYTRAPDF